MLLLLLLLHHGQTVHNVAFWSNPIHHYLKGWPLFVVVVTAAVTTIAIAIADDGVVPVTAATAVSPQIMNYNLHVMVLLFLLLLLLLFHVQTVHVIWSVLLLLLLTPVVAGWNSDGDAVYCWQGFCQNDMYHKSWSLPLHYCTDLSSNNLKNKHLCCNLLLDQTGINIYSTSLLFSWCRHPFKIWIGSAS